MDKPTSDRTPREEDAPKMPMRRPFGRCGEVPTSGMAIRARVHNRSSKRCRQTVWGGRLTAPRGHSVAWGVPSSLILPRAIRAAIKVTR